MPQTGETAIEARGPETLPNPRRAFPLGALAFGAGGGLVAALISHLSVMLAHRWTGDADIWLKGPHGPPFFDLTLSTSFYYGVLGLALGAGAKERLRAGAVGFGAAFIAIAAPMMIATYGFSWGEAPGAAPTYAWVYCVRGSYVFATTLAVAGIGIFAGRRRSRSRGERSDVLTRGAERIYPARRAAVGAAAGALLGALIAFGLELALSPYWNPKVEVIGLLAPLSAVVSGILWGALIALGSNLRGQTPKSPKSTCEETK